MLGELSRESLARRISKKSHNTLIPAYIRRDHTRARLLRGLSLTLLSGLTGTGDETRRLQMLTAESSYAKLVCPNRPCTHRISPAVRWHVQEALYEGFVPLLL